MQAPHWPIPQPLVPVRRRSSRITHTSWVSRANWDWAATVDSERDHGELYAEALTRWTALVAGPDNT